MKNKKINLSDKKQGFTLVEVIVAMFVFVLVMTSASVTFARAFEAYQDAKDIQKNMEDAQYAMNIMAKTFRTSSVVGFSDYTVEVYDYSQEKCFTYTFDGASLLRSEGTGDYGSCIPSGSVAMTTGEVSGRFYVEESEDGVAVGKIAVSMTIEKGSNVVHLQTTTSLRDYVESGVSL